MDNPFTITPMWNGSSWSIEVSAPGGTISRRKGAVVTELDGHTLTQIDRRIVIRRADEVLSVFVAGIDWPYTIDSNGRWAKGDNHIVCVHRTDRDVSIIFADHTVFESNDPDEGTWRRSIIGDAGVKTFEPYQLVPDRPDIEVWPDVIVRADHTIATKVGGVWNFHETPPDELVRMLTL